MPTKTNKLIEVKDQPTAAKMTSQNEDFLAMVPLSSIKVSSTNEMFRESQDLTEEAVGELAASIKEKGLLQPILLRASGNGGFILVAGERRFRACLSLGLTEIPAYVKQMSEEEAFELQLTENLQRKDVHPMKEAKAYHHLSGSGKYSTQELALRFGKSETYVLQRLRLMSLLPEIRKDFEAGDLNLAQALVIARMETADQKELLENCKNSEGYLASKRNYYQSAQELENYIAENITRELKSAPWDLSDAQLVAKAGPCSTCGKRSGAQAVLFADIKEKDRCFDSACFKTKLNACVLLKIKKLVEDKPDTVFLQAKGWGVEEPTKEVVKYLAAEKIKPLDSGSYDTTSYGNRSKAIKGFYINGDKAGHFATVYVAVTTAKTVKPDQPQEETLEDIQASIDRIQARTKQAAEMDDAKVYERILEAMSKDDILAKDNREATPAEYGLLAWMVYEHLGYEKKELFEKHFKLHLEQKEEKRADAFQNLPALKVLQMVRNYAAEATPKDHDHDDATGLLITRIAEDWGIPVEQFRKEQAEERAKREARAKERIKELKAKLPATPKKEKGGNAK